jgi:hypothetical protein
MKTPPIFAFTDCRDPNALTRLKTRLTTLFDGSSVHAVGINADIEASGCIVDTLDALRIGHTYAIIIGNLAPRTDKKHKNGAPFYLGYHNKTVIIATETCFALLAKLGLVTTIYETDVETVCKKFLPKKEAERIAHSQFRSFEYVPRLARWAYDKEKIPSVESEVHIHAGDQIWWVDNFGNCKTTITEDEIKHRVKGNAISLKINKKALKIPFYQKLADVPKGKPGIIIGSSGYEHTRFAEIVIQGASASAKFKIGLGSKIS